MSSNLRKTAIFLANFKYQLESNEWRVKWPIVHNSGKTYNPDFWCEDLNTFIELATSGGNIYCDGAKWLRSILLGYPLRVFWWEGMELTEKLKDGTILDQVRTFRGVERAISRAKAKRRLRYQNEQKRKGTK